MNRLAASALSLLGAAAMWLAAPSTAYGAQPSSTPAQPAQTPSAKPGATPAATTPGTPVASEKPGKVLTGRPARIAVLNFGPPSDWQGNGKDMVGVQINAASWSQALELLKKENAEKPIDVVAVRINSGGGYTAEVAKFHRVFEEYMKNFRTVMWIESAISAAILSPWPIPEIYVMPQGSLGGATQWSGQGVASEGMSLQMVLLEAENASRRAGRDPKIMRSMQIEDALSNNIDPDTGAVTWFQDETGTNVVKPYGRVLTLNAAEAVKYRIAKGTAATVDELVKAMGYSEWEIAGKRATKLIDDNMIELTKAEDQMQATYTKYNICVQGAASLPKEQRGAEVGRARQYLKQMADWKRKCMFIGPSEEWFNEQERVLRDLLK